MPYNPNANWSAKAALAEQAPVYFVAIEGLAWRYSTHPVRNASVEYRPFMKTPSGAAQEIFPLEGKSSIGTISFTLVDADGSVTDLVASSKTSPTLPTLINKEITLYGGYAEIDETDFAPLFRGQLTDWRLERGGAAYAFRAADMKRAAAENIMANATEAAPSVLEGNPLDIWYALMTGDFSNAQFLVVASGAAPTGLGVSSVFIDEAHLAKERDDWLFGWRMRFEFRKPERAKRFFEEELFVLKGYPVVRPDGRLSVRLYHPAHPAETGAELTAGDILGTPAVEPRFDDHLNHIQISGDYNPDFDSAASESEFTLLHEFKDSVDIMATKETKALKIESRGLRSSLDGVRSAAFASGKIRQRYLKPPLEIEAETFFTKRTLEAGEAVYVSHPHLPNMETGGRGWSGVACEVVKAQPDFRKGRMKFTLLTTNFGKRYRVVAPTGLSDYPAQGAAERARYASLAATATEQFSNGDAAHQLI